MGVLELLRIKNIAVIDHAEIHFKKGLNILSGETGAGKSIVIEAIALLLGGRAHSELLRAGTQEAVVEGLFQTAEITWLHDRMKEMGFDPKDGELLIKRIVLASGRNRIFINGGLATVGILQKLCEGLIDLCGQHEHQALVYPAVQLELLDRYGGIEKQALEARQLLSQLRALKKQKEELVTSEKDRERQRDFLHFQMNEISNAALNTQEDEELSQQKQLFQSAKTRIQLAESVCQTLEDTEEGTLTRLRWAQQKLKSLVAIDSSLSPFLEGFERATNELEDQLSNLERYTQSIDLDPERLDEIHERLSLIASLKRKYGSSVEAILETYSFLKKEHDSLSSLQDSLLLIDQKIKSVQEAFQLAAQKLLKIRKKIAKLFSTSVNAELQDLKMAEARFSVGFVEDDIEGVHFLVQTNRGEAARALSKIASGGELSRLMLSIRRIIADKGGIGVYLFDEIDAGIGGQVAFDVGKKLKSVASFNQVICITHLPQVAAFADNHLVVSKSVQGERTKTEVQLLDFLHQKEELARMLGGPHLTPKSLENAQELLELAKG